MSTGIYSTEDVRKRWAYAMAGDRIHRTQEYLDAFDAWLLGVKAEAWQEGRESLAIDAGRPVGADGFRHSTPNPYRPFD